jgi:hypothetical protein
MANEAQLFRILDDSTGDSFAPRSRIEGEAAASQRGAIGFAFKDSSGNVVLPQLDAFGRLLVTEEAGTCLSDQGANTVGSVGVDVDIATITLTVDVEYADLEISGSSFRDTLFTIVQNDNAVETVLHQFLVGNGDVNETHRLKCVEFTAGSTGTQQLILRAQNIHKASNMYGTIAIHSAA